MLVQTKYNGLFHETSSLQESPENLSHHSDMNHSVHFLGYEKFVPNKITKLSCTCFDSTFGRNSLEHSGSLVIGFPLTDKQREFTFVYPTNPPHSSFLFTRLFWEATNAGELATDSPRGNQFESFKCRISSSFQTSADLLKFPFPCWNSFILKNINFF